MAVPQCPGSFAHIHTGKALNGSLSILAEHVCDPKHNRMGGLKRAAMRPLPPAYLLTRLSWDSFSSAPGFWWGMGLSATDFTKPCSCSLHLPSLFCSTIPIQPPKPIPSWVRVTWRVSAFCPRIPSPLNLNHRFEGKVVGFRHFLSFSHYSPHWVEGNNRYYEFFCNFGFGIPLSSTSYNFNMVPIKVVSWSYLCPFPEVVWAHMCADQLSAIQFLRVFQRPVKIESKTIKSGYWVNISFLHIINNLSCS